MSNYYFPRMVLEAQVECLERRPYGVYRVRESVHVIWRKKDGDGELVPLTYVSYCSSRASEGDQGHA